MSTEFHNREVTVNLDKRGAFSLEWSGEKGEGLQSAYLNTFKKLG